MEFHIKLTTSIADLGAIEDAIREVDSSALVDVDPAGKMLRVATWFDADRLVSLIRQAGYSVDPLQVTQLPSICCGGCGG